ncbi:MAG: asparagine--tRNA ligase [Gammaproteobacteria bacterium]|nr:asparagine--tRNA ligase [Gammaproteobacteria bacterium]
MALRNSNRIRHLLARDEPVDDIEIRGWVRTRRDAKGVSFLELNDGSCRTSLQVVLSHDLPDFDVLAHQAGTGAAVSVRGSLAESPAAAQRWELQARALRIIGPSTPAYPLQKKRHSDEFLRTIAHLRPRTNKYGAMLRLRSRLSWAIHDFFQQRGFHCIHTPIVTGSDCEGAGAMFRVTTLDPAQLPRAGGGIDWSQDFFGREAKLTVSGQLSAETCCMALGDVYTFGPTFRAENSNTSRHMAEFWMIEPEMAFADLDDDMDLAEAMVKHLVAFAMEDCAEDLELFAKFVDPGLMARLDNILAHAFERLSYTEAVDILQRAGERFEFPVDWGCDLQSEHERYLTEKHFGKPVILRDYPRALKAFYMRGNDDGRTVAAMDLLVPGVGELIGGSQREERYDVLTERIEAFGFRLEDYWWYLDTRRYGGCPHAGFGLGFERFLMFLTGAGNIRDVIPFPRTPRHLEF